MNIMREERAPSHSQIRRRIMRSQMMSRVRRKIDIRKDVFEVRPEFSLGGPVIIERVVDKLTQVFYQRRRRI
jgi:hypothetical protein